MLSSSKKFQKEVSVHLSHCAVIDTEEEASNYKFILGKCSQKSLPYTFKMKDGIFPPHSQLATLSVKEFSFFAAIFRGKKRPRLMYNSHYYLRHVEPHEWEASFLVTLGLPSQLQVWMLKCKLQPHQYFLICFYCQAGGEAVSRSMGSVA